MSIISLLPSPYLFSHFFLLYLYFLLIFPSLFLPKQHTKSNPILQYINHGKESFSTLFSFPLCESKQKVEITPLTLIVNSSIVI